MKSFSSFSSIETTPDCHLYRQKWRVFNYHPPILKELVQCNMLGNFQDNYIFINICAPGLKKTLGFVFMNFDWITRISFDICQHAMYTICILFTILHYSYDENIVYVRRSFKANYRPQNSTALIYPPLGTKYFCCPCVDVCNKN